MKTLIFLLALALHVSIISCVTVPSKSREDLIAARLDSLFLDAEQQGFHGNVLIVKDDKTLLLKGYGYANVSGNIKFGPSTLVQIGSNVKDFTKVAIYQLKEKGRLKLSDSLAMYIPGLPPLTGGITIHQLLNHRAGLPLGMGGDDYPLTADEMIRNLRTLVLLFPTGKKEHYSNIGYSLLAYIIGKISGIPYDRYVADNILKPAGMTETGSYIPHFDTGRIAHGYRGNTDQGTILDMPHDAEGHYWNLRGNGGYLSTLTDMHRFYKSLEKPILLTDEAHLQEIFPRDEGIVLAGSDRVCFFLFASMPGLKAEIIIASNHSEYMGNKLLRPAEEILGEKPRSKNPAPFLDRLPGNNTGTMIESYLKAYNSGDTKLIQKFFENYASENPDAPPLTARIERYKEMFDNLGKLTFKSFRPSADTESWEVIVATEKQGEVELTFIPDSKNPDKLMGIRVIAEN